MKLSLPSLYEVIKTTINNPLFLEKHRLLKNAFTRNRLLNFPTLILYLLKLRKHSNQVELDQFFKAINDEKIASQVITKSAFFQSRKQVSYTAFVALNQSLINEVYKQSNGLKTWKGFRLCAIDGTSIRLPNNPDITKYFGIQKGREGQAGYTMGMASVFLGSPYFCESSFWASKPKFAAKA